jgi:hypothetical protein
VASSQTNPPPYADLEIRLLDRQAAGYPVELTVAGRQLPRGFLDPSALPLPWRAGARLVTTFQDEAQVSHEALIREWPTSYD